MLPREYSVIDASMYKLALLAIVALAGCGPDVRVIVHTLTDGQISIEAIDRKGGHPCVNDIVISELRAAPAAWAIERQASGICKGVFTYPVVPEGYLRVRVPHSGENIRHGIRYRVDVSGDGFASDAEIVG